VRPRTNTPSGIIDCKAWVTGSELDIASL